MLLVYEIKPKINITIIVLSIVSNNWADLKMIISSKIKKIKYADSDLGSINKNIDNILGFINACKNGS